MQASKVEEIFKRFLDLNPNPQTELKYTNSYTLLVAVVLSAQATDVSVNKATEKLFKLADTPEKMLLLGEEGLKSHIKSINYLNSKARNVIALSQILVEKFQSQVPHSREDLESLPGVGRKTANVVLNVAFGEPTLAVDTHIFRVSNRIGLAHAKTPLETEQQLLKVIPEHFRHHAHHWLILHGRYICKARKPLCAKCPINDICEYPDKDFG